MVYVPHGLHTRVPLLAVGENGMVFMRMGRNDMRKAFRLILALAVMLSGVSFSACRQRQKTRLKRRQSKLNTSVIGKSARRGTLFYV